MTVTIPARVAGIWVWNNVVIVLRRKPKNYQRYGTERRQEAGEGNAQSYYFG